MGIGSGTGAVGKQSQVQAKSATGGQQKVQWIRQKNGQTIRSQGRRKARRNRYKPGDQEQVQSGTRVQESQEAL